MALFKRDKKQKISNAFYSLKRILRTGADYMVIFGKRSNGKSYAVQALVLEHFIKTGEQCVIFRRFKDHFVGDRGENYFDNMVINPINGNLVEKFSNGEWNTIKYYRRAWYLAKYDPVEQTLTRMDVPFAYAISVNEVDGNKGRQFPLVKYIVFEEFLTDNEYEVRGEFDRFLNNLSTIIRGRSDVKIFMLANSVKRHSTYFTNMKLKNVRNMEPGDLDVYTYENSPLIVAVEFAERTTVTQGSDKYFEGFTSSSVQMITGGDFVVNNAPKKPTKYRPKDVVFTYFIIYEEECYQCEVIIHEKTTYTYIHRKTTELQSPDKDLIFSLDYDVRPNWRRNITKPIDEVNKRIYEYFVKEKVYYQDNEVADSIASYINWCRQNR